MATPPQDPDSGAKSHSPAPDIESGSWLADGIGRVVSAHSASNEKETMAALEALCAAARNAGLPVEGVLVPLKRLWQARTASDVPLRAGPTDDHLAWLVSSCIITYYGPS